LAPFLVRLKKIIKDKDAIIEAMKNELILKDQEMNSTQKRLVELKDLLQSSVQERSKEKRMGK